MENTENTKNYYNAKPSKISNIGLDIAGAKRMNFDTYETTEQKEIKERKKTQDKQITNIKLAIKTEVLSESPSIPAIIELMTKQFELTHALDINTAKDVMTSIDWRSTTREERADLNKKINAFNKYHREVRRLNYNPSYMLRKMKAKYASKESFTEQSGQSFDWKDFDQITDLKDTVSFLSSSVKALQFGNSVSDNERACISFELSEFLKQWAATESLKSVDLAPVCWSFGARGKAGSVAYYQASGKIVSVNRNNIGSIIHELGHYIDHVSGTVSRDMSYATVKAYEETLPKEMPSKQRRYYASRCEIFARAFEAYCFEKLFGFSKFVQCGKAYLPELNEELIALVEKALNFTK